MFASTSEPVVSKARDLNPATLSAGKAQTAEALVAQARSKKRAVSPATHTTPQPNNNSSSKKKKTQPASSTAQAPHLSQVAPVESTSEGKPVGAVDVETSAKCLPFKNPNFVANYTDPQTKLRFASTQEFSYIRQLLTDVVTGYLALRKATCIVP